MNIAVVGGHSCSRRVYGIAREVGRLIAREGWVLITGGGPGVMEAASRGAKEAGGLCVGILPGWDASQANRYVDVRLPTGLGYARNVLVVRAADALIAIDGEYGTLSEIAFAFIVGIGTWKIKGLRQVTSARQALRYLKTRLQKPRHAQQKPDSSFASNQ